jgi:hypothetical protein
MTDPKLWETQMSNAHEINNTKLLETEARELTPAELECVSGGGKNASSGKGSSGVVFLEFKLKEVLVSLASRPRTGAGNLPASALASRHRSGEAIQR